MKIRRRRERKTCFFRHYLLRQWWVGRTSALNHTQQSESVIYRRQEQEGDGGTGVKSWRQTSCRIHVDQRDCADISYVETPREHRVKKRHRANRSGRKWQRANRPFHACGPVIALAQRLQNTAINYLADPVRTTLTNNYLPLVRFRRQ